MCGGATYYIWCKLTDDSNKEEFDSLRTYLLTNKLKNIKEIDYSKSKESNIKIVEQNCENYAYNKIWKANMSKLQQLTQTPEQYYNNDFTDKMYPSGILCCDEYEPEKLFIPNSIADDMWKMNTPDEMLSVVKKLTEYLPLIKKNEYTINNIKSIKYTINWLIFWASNGFYIINDFKYEHLMA
jgi:hypothetical protein